MHEQVIAKLKAICSKKSLDWTVGGHHDRPQNFLLGQVSFRTGQNIGKKLTYSCVISIWESDFLSKEQNLSFTGEDFGSFSRMRVSEASQSRHVKFLASKVIIQHCPLTGHYFERWRYNAFFHYLVHWKLSSFSRHKMMSQVTSAGLE